jgi:hypothetical protein
MTREIHVRFRGSRRVRPPPATRPSAGERFVGRHTEDVAEVGDRGKQRTPTSNIRFGHAIDAALHALKTIRTSGATVTIARYG